MMQWLRAVILGAVLCSAASASTTPSKVSIEPGQAQNPPSDLEDRITGAARAAQTNPDPAELQRAGEQLKDLMARPDFAQTPAPTQGTAYAGAAWAAARQGKLELARDMMARSLELDPGEGWNHMFLARVQSDLGDNRAALQHLLQYLQADNALRTSDEDWLLALVHFSDRKIPERAVALEVTALYDWEDNDRLRSNLAYELALSRLAAGNTQGIAGLLDRITLPDLLMQVRIDKRFDPFVDRRLPAFNVGRAARLRVGVLKSTLPDPLTPSKETAELFRAMLTAGEHEQVLALSKPMVGEASADTDAKALGSIRESRAYALMLAGRVDEAVATQEAAASTLPNGKVNVNQTLDLAGFYCDLGRGKDALAAAQRVEDNMNAFGRFAKAYQQHCAYVLLKDSAAAERELAYLQEHRDLHPVSALDALIRAGRLDAAATAYKQMLKDEDTRPDALVAAQGFLPVPDSSAADAAKHRQWWRFLKRRDVQAAINAVGRIEHFDIYR